MEALIKQVLDSMILQEHEASFMKCLVDLPSDLCLNLIGFLLGLRL